MYKDEIHERLMAVRAVIDDVERDVLSDGPDWSYDCSKLGMVVDRALDLRREMLRRAVYQQVERAASEMRGEIGKPSRPDE